MKSNYLKTPKSLRSGNKKASSWYRGLKQGIEKYTSEVRVIDPKTNKVIEKINPEIKHEETLYEEYIRTDGWQK